MASEGLINILASCITGSMMIVIGALLFKLANGGLRIPLLSDLLFGNKNVAKVTRFVVFFASVTFFIWFYPWIKVQIETSTIDDTQLIAVGALISIFLFLIFDFSNY